MLIIPERNTSISISSFFSIIMVNNESAPTQSVPEELYNLTQLADVTLAAGKLSTDASCIESNVYLSDQLTNLIPVRQSTYSVVGYGSVTAQELNDGDRQRTKNACSSSDDDTYTSGSSGLSFTKNYAHKIFDKRKARQQLLSTYVTPPSNCSSARSSSASSLTPVNLSENEASKPDKHRTKCVNEVAATQLNAGNSDVPSTERDLSRLSIVPSENAITAEQHNESSTYHDAYDDDYGGDLLDGNEGDDTDIHVCPECGKKYSTSSNLARHRQTHRSLMDKKARRCPHCDKVYVSMPAFSMHVRTHNQGCECPHCGKRFSRPWLLQGHIRTHTGEKPFECSICSKAFADKSNLRAHIQTHSNTKPHTCTRCGKSFALKSYLYKHEESSCARNINKTSTKCSMSETLFLSDKFKSKRRSDLSSSSSPINTMAGKFASNDPVVLKSTKKVKSSCELQRKCREKIRYKLTRTVYNEKSVAVVDCQSVSNIIHQNVNTDCVSNKSYIELSKPHMKTTCPRVIRSIVSNEKKELNEELSGVHDAYISETNIQQDDFMKNTSGISMGFYQEIPMDFSPKATKKCSNSGCTFGISSKYVLIA